MARCRQPIVGRRAGGVEHRVGKAQGEGSRLRGIACGAGAGALWGLVFLAPELVEGFGPVQLS